MDSLSSQQLNMAAACVVTYDKTDLISDLGKAASGTKDDFQKLMDKAASGAGRDAKTESQPKAEKSAAKKNNGQQEEDPIEASKRLQVYLAPVSPEELSQYPASWLPQGLEEGEPIVCIGVRTGENGEQIPILVGANTAEKMYGKQVVAPWQTFDVSDPKADAMLEATAPDADNSPAAMLEKLTAEQFGQEVRQVTDRAAETANTAVQPEDQLREGDEPDGKLLDVEQAPQRLFHDVKAAPVKVGEVYDPERADEPDVAGQIDAGLARALEQGESLVRIQLNPEHLGSVTVELARSTEGVIRVALSAHSAETRSLLERHAGELQGLISNRTQQSVEVNVQRQSESQQGQNQQHQQGYDGRGGHDQDAREQRRQHQEHGRSQDFIQQLRLGLIPSDE